MITQERQRGGNAAGGFQPAFVFRRIGDVHAPRRAVAQRVFDLAAEPGVVDDDVAKTGGVKPAQVVDNQRFAAGFQQRLGRAVGQRTHTLAASGGQNHGFHGEPLCSLGVSDGQKQPEKMLPAAREYACLAFGKGSLKAANTVFRLPFAVGRA